MAVFRIGILGCGGIANRHASILARLTNRAEMVAFCDTIKERAEDFSQRYSGGKGTVFTDFADMYDRSGLDVVFICLPPFAHTNEVELAAKLRVHVFIEKPIALGMETANRMVDAVESAGLKSQVGFMSRFGEAVETVKKMLDSGEAGQPGLMIGTYFANSLHAPWWRDKSKSGGQVVEQIVHTFDVIRFFLGEVDTVFAQMSNLFHRDVESYTSEDVSGTVISFKSGAVATVAGTNSAIPNQWLSQYQLVAKNLTAYFSGPNNATLHYTGGPAPKQCVLSSEKDISLYQALDLLDAIEQNKPTRTPMIEGAKTLRLVLAASRSAETGQPVGVGG